MKRLILACLVLSACDDDVKQQLEPDLAAAPDFSPAPDMADPTCPTKMEDVSACMHAADDYEPRQNGSAGDQWPACISDDNTFHQLGASPPSTSARTLAWDSMALKLWRNAAPPTMQNFLDARNEYSVAQGIGSRVDRRQDIHYPEVPGAPSALACTNAGIPLMYPDRCAGPAKLTPLINDAFQKGIAQMQPRVQAARIEAALLWFFYLSTLSEVWTCSFDKKDDCDSALAYYNAFTPRDELHGLASYIQPLGPETHQRAFDGFLAERCWRDLDQALPATNTALYTRASNQIDRAELRGLALIARQRFGLMPCLSGEERLAAHEFLKILIGFLDRDARARNAGHADILEAQVERPDAAAVDVPAAQAALDALYPCP
jgi:hypothetical protein